MSSLQVGIVGLPNAGKSTLFNALRGEAEKLAKTSPVPFTTIDPNVGVVQVPDQLLLKLAKVAKTIDVPKIVPATVTFIDIAGLIKNAHKGEGLGNQFLAKIREVNAIVHVVASYDGEINIEKIIDNIETVNIELELGDIKDKPTIYLINISEKDIAHSPTVRIDRLKKKLGPETQVLVMSAKLEEELIDLEIDERRDYLKELGVKQLGLEKLIRTSYELLDLVTFYTIKPSSAKATEGRGSGNIISAWSIKNGSTALDAAAVVHTDFAEKFIKAEVINIDKLLAAGPEGPLARGGNWKKAKDGGLIRLEGRDYKIQDKDVVEFKVGN